MCTLVFGLHVCGPGTVVLATNRDEDPARPSEPPQVLAREPLVVGGRDAMAGGTWLALRARAGNGEPGVAMLLNRRDPTPEKQGRRSRGLLTLDVATAPDPRERALAEAAIGHYAPCSLIWLSPSESWHLSIRAGQKPTIAPVAPGWHAITHFEMDDASDPRATWALQRLAGVRSPSRADAEKRLAAILASHGGGAAPAICLHEGRAPTVSAAMLWLAAGEVGYRHAQGRPCVTPFEDCSALVGRTGATEGKAATDSGCRVIASGASYRGLQGFAYRSGLTGESAGSKAISMTLVTLPDGARANTHLHRGIETAVYVIEGEVEMLHGERLEQRLVARAGEYVYIPADAPHRVMNRSGAVCRALVAHTANDDQAGIVLLPELDALDP